jgi:hypothetical protein
MKITKRPIFAADDDFSEDESLFDDVMDAPEETIGEDVEEEEAIEEGENIEEDDVAIDVDNNIVNHLIAECDNCKGIFISAMIASEQEVDSINGICPLCNKDTTQLLRWIIKDYPEEEE